MYRAEILQLAGAWPAAMSTAVEECRQLGDSARALGDVDAARMESAAARVSFERPGAAPDLAGGPAPGRLTPRECEILRLVATGATTRPSRIG